jgi:hypothetical protein
VPLSLTSSIRTCVIDGAPAPRLEPQLEIGTGPLLRFNWPVIAPSARSYLRLNHHRRDSAITVDIDERSGLLVAVEIGIHPLIKSFDELPNMNAIVGCCSVYAPSGSSSRYVNEIALEGEWNVYHDGVNWAILNAHLTDSLVEVREQRVFSVFVTATSQAFAGVRIFDS